jgi:hypothetical protein
VRTDRDEGPRQAAEVVLVASLSIIKMPDDFLDPVGVLVSAQLNVLAAQLRGEVQGDVVREALDELMRLQAVCVRDASQAATSVVDLLRERLAASGADPRVGSGLDRIAALAVELFARHRVRIERIRERELERSRFVERRVRQRAGAA